MLSFVVLYVSVPGIIADLPEPRRAVIAVVTDHSCVRSKACMQSLNFLTFATSCAAQAKAS